MLFSQLEGVPMDPMTREVEVRLRAQKVLRFRKCMVVLVWVALFFICNAMGNISAGMERTHSLGQVVLMLTVYFLLILGCHGRLLSARTADAWYAALMSTMALYVSPMLCPGKYVVHCTGLAKIGCAALSLGRLQTPIVVGANLVYLLSACSSLRSSEALSTDSLRRCFIIMECVYTLLVGFLVFALECWARVELRLEIKGQGFVCKRSVGHVLLRMVYDVVVELDSTLHIKGPAHELGGLLLHGPRRSLEGLSLLDLLPDAEDRQLILERMAPAQPSEEPHGEVWCVRMRDSDSNSIGVEAFSMPFGDFQGNGGYLVGIREAQENAHNTNKAQTPPRDDGLGLRPDEVYAKVDTSLPDFPIQEFSPHFTSLVGPVAQGSSLLRSVDDRGAFSRWVQMVMNMHLGGSPQEEVARRNFLEVRIRRRRGQARQILRANCRILLDAEDEEGNDDPLAVRLVFSPSRQDQGAQRRNGTAASSGGTSALGGSSRLGSTGVPLRRSASGRSHNPDEDDEYTGAILGRPVSL